MKILASIDLSDSSKIVGEFAKTLAGACSAKLWLLHVAAPDPDFVGYDVDTKTMRDVVAERFHKEHQTLHRLAEEFRSAGLDCTALLIQGATVETILSQAEKLAPDMILLGSHGKGLIKQLLIGSTSEAVLHQSKIPVLIVPTRG